MDAELDKSRPVGNLSKYLDEVASLLMNLPNVETSFRVVVDIAIPDGVPEEIRQIVLDNCRDLKISNAHFEP